MEQLFNYAAMRHMTIQQALHSGQYGPVNRMGGSIGNISDKTRRLGDAALAKVGAGSNIIDYATDQGMAGDPNFSKYMSNRPYWNMHKVEGAWFSSHGEQGRKWAQQERAGDRDLLSTAQKSGINGGSQKVEGSADLRVAFENAPAGAKAYMQYGGMFKSGKVDWGHAMSPSDPGGR